MTDTASLDPVVLDPPGEPRIISRDQHCISRSLIDEDVLKILHRLSRHDHLAYLVGGSVRDLLLGRAPKDFDVGTDATPSQIKRLFRNCFLVGRRFRLAHIRFHGDKVVEVATFRRSPAPEELPDDPGDYLHFVENVFGSPRQDAFRRDFTINALFYDIATFSIIDHVGGIEDLHARRLRVIGDPVTRFQEDPVRMLRALELSARLDFTLDPGLEEGMRRCAPLIAGASPSRLRDEVLELFRYGVAGKVLPAAQRYGLLPHLLAGYGGDPESFALLQRLDGKTLAGSPMDEALAIAALFLVPFLTAFPPKREGHVVEALRRANDILLPHCRYFSIAQRIRQQARELLAGCFRLARGTGLRGEARFLHHPLTPQCLELFSLYVPEHPELVELSDRWRRLVGGVPASPEPPAGEGRPRRRRRRRFRSRAPRTAPETEKNEP